MTDPKKNPEESAGKATIVTLEPDVEENCGCGLPLRSTRPPSPSPLEPDLAENCGVCHFQRDGECRRHAPMAQAAGIEVAYVDVEDDDDGPVDGAQVSVTEWVSEWPSVVPEDWCGDFEPKKLVS